MDLPSLQESDNVMGFTFKFRACYRALVSEYYYAFDISISIYFLGRSSEAMMDNAARHNGLENRRAGEFYPWY